MIALRGRGTAELAGLRSGDKAELTGPLGNAWTDFLPAETGGGKIALIGGGIGIAPLIALALELRDAGADFDSLRRVHTPAPWGGTGGMNPESNTLQEQHTPSACGGVVDFYAGFKTLSSNPEDTEYEDFLGPLSRHGGEAGKIVLATEDGGRGNTDPWNMGRIPDFLDPGRYRAVCACGPEPMLKVVRAKCAAAGVPCFISMERRMACGVGACLGCIVKTTGGNRRCCADGPVFPAAEILFED
jgi:NAD(P)H-flavin reductase